MIWIVDDDQDIREFLRLAVGLYGFSARAFGSLAEAEQAWQAEAVKPLVLMTDWSLQPGGIADWIWQRDRSVPIVVMSGDPDAARELPDNVFWLPKPFRMADLARLLAQWQSPSDR